MSDRTSNDESRSLSVRDRRFCIRYPFAADVVVLNLETGSRTDGVTCDLSLGGIFVCTSKPLASNTRVRVTLTKKDQKLEALGMVRIVKPRRSEEHTSELQSRLHLVCRLLLEKKKKHQTYTIYTRITHLS